jgi:hypothetical protein
MQPRPPAGHAGLFPGSPGMDSPAAALRAVQPPKQRRDEGLSPHQARCRCTPDPASWIRASLGPRGVPAAPYRVANRRPAARARRSPLKSAARPWRWNERGLPPTARLRSTERRPLVRVRPGTAARTWSTCPRTSARRPARTADSCSLSTRISGPGSRAPAAHAGELCSLVSAGNGGCPSGPGSVLRKENQKPAVSPSPVSV